MKRLVVVAGLLLVPLNASLAETGLAVRCAQVQTDATIRPYDPLLRAGLLNAYARLFPDARMPPDKHQFRGGALSVAWTGA